VSEPATRLVLALVGCVCFGYAAANCLIFYGRTREQASHYSTKLPLEKVVHSPYYDWTIWATGIIGLIGFLISSWEAVLSLLALVQS
jgi:hypothetical protein